MILDQNFITSYPQLFVDYLTLDATERSDFFAELLNLASQDLAMAHSVFKTSACKVVLGIAGMEVKDHSVIGAFGTNKPYDTVTLSGNTITGKKHWITNLKQAHIGTIQVQSETGIQLVLVELGDVEKDFNYLNTVGMQDTCTGDAVFANKLVTPLFHRNDVQYFISNNHNNLCFIVNYLGAVKGLMKYTKNERLTSEFLNLVSLVDFYIKTTSFNTTPSDDFWHARNSLYLASKQLLIDIIGYIIGNEGGKFYDSSTQQGKHFYNCLVYSSHNGSIETNRKTLFVENQDY